MTDDYILDDIFHGCAFAAYLQLALASKNWPDVEHTRRLAFRIYEEGLTEKNEQARTTCHPPKVTI